MRVLGVDPGVARTGIAVVDGVPGRLSLVYAGCLETPAEAADAERLWSLFRELKALLAEHRPETVAVEQLFFATNRRSAMRVGEARGVVLCAVAGAGLGVVEYTPPQVKEAVSGWGAASKGQVGRMVRSLLGVADLPGPDDVADACAVAICHHHRQRLGGMLGVRDRGAVSSRLAEAIARAAP
jgi:crossover junction endodeoxyribonuclease RuvC